MNHVPDTELFSAYLDGELTADEQVRAEQILAASAEARQLLEELRALQGTVQGLSQEKLGEDISARVLEIAERRMLLPESPDNRPAAGRAAESLNLETDSLGWLGIRWREVSWRGMLSPRALAWSAVVVVTAIIIHFTSPQPNQNIARNDRPAEPGERSAAQPSVVAGSGPVSSEHVKEAPRTASSLAAEVKEPATAGKFQESSIPPDGVWDRPADQKRELRVGEKLAEKSLHKANDAKDSANVIAKDRKVDEDLAKKSTPARRDAADKLGDTSRALALRGDVESHAGAAGEESVDGKPAPEPFKEAGVRYKTDPIDAVREEKAKSTSSIDGIAAAKPASPPVAAPMPADPRAEKAPSPSTGQPGVSLADVSKPAGDSMSSNTEMSKPSLFSKTRGTERVANAKSGSGALGTVPNKAIPEAAGIAGPASKGDVSKQTLNEPVGQKAGDRREYGGASAAGNRKGGQVPLNRFSDQAPTIVRLNVSAVAVRNRVFENLLANHGLASDKIQTNVALDGQASAQNFSYFQLNQAGQGIQSPYLPQNFGAGMGGMGGGLGGGNVPSAPSRSPIPLGLAGGGLNRPAANPQTDPSSAQKDARPSLPIEDLGQSRSDLQGKAAAKAEGGTHAEVRTAVKDNGIKDNAIGDNAVRDNVVGVREQEGLAPLVYEFDATAEQLVNIMKQIRDKPSSFAPLEPVLDDNYRAADYAGYGGRAMSQRLDIQKQSKVADGTRSFSAPATQPQAVPAATAQSQAGPDAAVQSQLVPAPARIATQQASPPVAGAVRQHVVFIFNVVDRLSPVAAAASRAPVQTPAPASQSPVAAPAAPPKP
jgi:hypothetical protein